MYNVAGARGSRSIAIAKVDDNTTGNTQDIANMRVVIARDFCLPRIFQVHRDDPIFTLQTTDHPERNRLAYVVKKDDDIVVTVSLKGWIHTWSLSTGQHTRSFQSNNTARVGGIALCNNILRCTHSDNTHQGGL